MGKTTDNRGCLEKKRSIALIGLKHSGKSSVAQSLSQSSGRPLIDTDLLICSESGYKSARQAFKMLGESGFKKLEYKVCRKLAVRAAHELLIIATGGGIADNKKAMETLKQVAEFIYLREPADVLYNRFIQNGCPAFLPEKGSREAWANIYDRRDRIYSRRADLTVECDNRAISDIADELKQWLDSKT